MGFVELINVESERSIPWTKEEMKA